MARRGGYTAAVHPPDIKAALGAIGRQLRARGITVTEVASIFSEAWLRRWRGDPVGAAQPIASPNKQAGNDKTLDDEQRRVAAGWVLL
jgi:hypothetical protein